MKKIKKKQTKNSPATKRDLYDVKTIIKKEVQDAKTVVGQEIQDVRTELKEEIQDVRTELKEEIQDVKIEMDKLNKKVDGMVIEKLDWIIGSIKKFEEEHIILTYRQVNHSERIEKLETTVFGKPSE